MTTTPNRPKANKLSAAPMAYITGEEMTREIMKMVLEQWIEPYIDTSAWETFDLSCKNRDNTGDQVLKDAIAAGAKLGSIFKEPTITATAEQAAAMGLKKPQGSPNGKMREGWNGYSIDRDTIHIAGLESIMGYVKPVLFCRHAVGGEYGGTGKIVGAGTLKTIFTGADGKEEVIETRTLVDKENAAVIYHNPYDNVHQLARHFFGRSLEAGVKPYVVTKKTVFKWQEKFWQIMKEVFDAEFKAKFREKTILGASEELTHILSDDASMKLPKWRGGGYSMAAHNYDGDVLTDLMSQIHRSPAFVSSVLTGVAKDGSKIMEFEASHGTVSDQYKEFMAGKHTSVNPLGMVYGLRGAMDHAATLATKRGQINADDANRLKTFTELLYASMCEAMAEGKGTRDLYDTGLNTEDFITVVASKLTLKINEDFGGSMAGADVLKFAKP